MGLRLRHAERLQLALDQRHERLGAEEIRIQIAARRQPVGQALLVEQADRIDLIGSLGSAGTWRQA